VSLFGARRHPRTAPLPVEGRLPGFEGATGWLNSSPLTPEGLAEKVVLPSSASSSEPQRRRQREPWSRRRGSELACAPAGDSARSCRRRR
jgi:hypothetical protein